MLEPRRLAAAAVATRIAELLGEQVGERAGYRVRSASRVSRATRIEVVTEALLTRAIQEDPLLAGTGLVIFDEFHERSLHADLALALTLEVRRARPDLAVLVMSATLDTQRIVEVLGTRGSRDRRRSVLHCPGKLFPVETRYSPLEMPRRALGGGIRRRVRRLLRKDRRGPARLPAGGCRDTQGRLPAVSPDRRPRGGSQPARLHEPRGSADGRAPAFARRASSRDPRHLDRGDEPHRARACGQWLTRAGRGLPGFTRPRAWTGWSPSGRASPPRTSVGAGREDWGPAHACASGGNPRGCSRSLIRRSSAPTWRGWCWSARCGARGSLVSWRGSTARPSPRGTRRGRSCGCSGCGRGRSHAAGQARRGAGAFPAAGRARARRDRQGQGGPRRGMRGSPRRPGWLGHPC